ncbi:universal stress protein [Streptomyces daqingensis]|uniref:Universal stress protein n=1 Tax=Streptomyces daqingensis TaxID=1472640 RepID=A0ABQ2MMH7_9ACTN|nr:universal stress protein [Streptomyces daqingensis]
MVDGPVTVGVDGSPSSIKAVEQGAEEARLRGATLRLLHAYTHPYVLPPAPLSATALPFGPAGEALREMGERYVTEAEERARAAAPQIDVSTEVVQGEVLSVLVDASETSSLMVVGRRGLGGFASLLLGSAGLHLSAHAHCPVMALRGTPKPSGDIVLGVDGSPAAQLATEFAFHEASLRGARLAATHVFSEWSVPLSPPEDESMPYARRPGSLREDEERLLSEALAGRPEKYPDVTVEHRCVRGATREKLIEASDSAQLLVVGARGRGGFSGLLLGSVSQAALHHARCPVVVARHSR